MVIYFFRNRKQQVYSREDCRQPAGKTDLYE